MYQLFFSSPHIHCMLWIEDAPRLGENTPEEVAEYIDKILTCHLPTKEEDETLYNLVQYQMHRHSHTCCKGRKFQCRFNYPLPPMRKTVILEPLSAEENTDKYKEKWKEIYKKLNDMKMGENITFEEFLQKLNIQEEEYMKAVRASIKSAKYF